MRKFLAILLVLTVAFALNLGTVGANNGVPAEEKRGVPVPTRPGVSEWVFVYPVPDGVPGKGKPSSSYDKCTDGQQSDYKLFAKAKIGGLVFNVNPTSGRPSYISEPAWVGAAGNSFAPWETVDSASTYFTVNSGGGADRPGLDGNNTVGWAFLVPTGVLAAAWVWTDDATGQVIEADIFFSNYHPWGIYDTCNADPNSFEVRNVGSHEVGHVVALDHIKDTYGHATLYPSAPKGEVKKHTLTTGDADGFLAALDSAPGGGGGGGGGGPPPCKGKNKNDPGC